MVLQHEHRRRQTVMLLVSYIVHVCAPRCAYVDVCSAEKVWRVKQRQTGGDNGLDETETERCLYIKRSRVKLEVSRRSQQKNI